MTSAIVSDIASNQTNLASQPASNAKESGFEKTDFGTLMNQSSKSSLSIRQTADHVMNMKKSTDTMDTASYSSQQKNIKSVGKTEKKAETVSAEKASGVTEKLEDGIKKELEDKLGVTEEQIDEAMETLGLTVVDLLQPENLVNLVQELTGSTDMSQLLLNPGMQDIMKEIPELTNQILEDAGVSAEQLVDFQNELASLVNEMTEVAETDLKVTEEDLKRMPELQNGMEMQNADQNGQTVKLVNDSLEMKDVVDSGESQESDLQTESGTQSTSTDQMKNDASSEDGMDENTSKQNQDVNHFAYASQDTNVQDMNVKSEVPQTTAYQMNVDVDEIMKQISEFAKVNIANDTSSIEMQLNPANLGKVMIHVSEKEGNVTAQIQTQNEAVKEALETQVAELKQTLEGQGVKVTSVEVTVASHEFEQNLEQNSMAEERQAEEQETRSGSGRRSINLNNLDDLQGLMTEEEVLTAQIMKDNGNSVDLTA